MTHAIAADKFNQDFDRTTWHDENARVRQKRDRAAFAIPEWEELNMASQIKHNVLSNLDTYLVDFEKNA
ncbi:MAG: hypothetical protein R2822_12950 [Spirosomataceae bacterium]